MRKNLFTTISIALAVSLCAVPSAYAGNGYDKGWDAAYDPGAAEAQGDVCGGDVYHIDEDFCDDSGYDKGWEQGYRTGYDESYKDGCQTDDSSANNKGKGKNKNKDNNGNQNQEEDTSDIAQSPNSELTQEVKESLAYMGNEERLAYDIYTTLYNYHMDKGTEINQFANIVKSEQKHIEIVQNTIQKYNLDISKLSVVVDPVADKDVAFEDMPMGKYDVPAIQELYDSLYEKGVASKQAALEVGCIVEVVDIDDLDEFILQAEVSNATDIVDAFNILRDGSYNHFWAFDKGLKAIGVDEGCAVLGAKYEKAVEEYPNNKGDSDKGNKGKGKN